MGAMTREYCQALSRASPIYFAGALVLLESSKDPDPKGANMTRGQDPSIRARAARATRSGRKRKGRSTAPMLVASGLAVARSAFTRKGRTGARRPATMVVQISRPRRRSSPHLTRMATVVCGAFIIGRWWAQHPEQVKHYQDVVRERGTHLRELIDGHSLTTDDDHERAGAAR